MASSAIQSLLFATSALALASCESTRGGAYGNSDEHANRLSVYVGARGYDDNDWDPVEEQDAVGFDFAHGRGRLAFEGGVFAALANEKRGGAEFTGKTAEFSGGVRLCLFDGALRPYIGLGLASIFMKLDQDGVGSAHDGSIGGYAHVGVTLDVTEYVFLGLDARGLKAGDVDVLGRERDVDYSQLAVVVGFSF